MDVSRWSGLITSCREIQPAQYSTVHYRPAQAHYRPAPRICHRVASHSTSSVSHHEPAPASGGSPFSSISSNDFRSCTPAPSFCLWLVVGEVLPGPGVWVAVPCVGGTLIIIPLMLFLPRHEVMGHCYTRNHSSTFTIIIGSK